MPVSVTMPRLGESVTEGTVTRWLKQEGEHVDADEPLLEVSTDKVDTEVPSPASGTVLSIKVGEDETVEIGVELAVIGDAADAGQPAVEQPPADQPVAAQPPADQPVAAQPPADASASAAPPPFAAQPVGGAGAYRVLPGARGSAGGAATPCRAVLGSSRRGVRPPQSRTVRRQHATVRAGARRRPGRHAERRRRRGRTVRHAHWYASSPASAGLTSPPCAAPASAAASVNPTCSRPPARRRRPRCTRPKAPRRRTQPRSPQPQSPPRARSRRRRPHLPPRRRSSRLGSLPPHLRLRRRPPRPGWHRPPGAQRKACAGAWCRCRECGR